MKRVISWAGFGLLFLAVTVFCLSPHSRSPVEVVDKASLFAAFATLAFIATLLIQERWSVWLILADRSEEHKSELQSLMRISYDVFCLKKQKTNYKIQISRQTYTTLI